MISIYVHKPSCDCILSRCAGLCWNVYWLRWYGREYGFFLVLSLMLALMNPRFTLTLLASMHHRVTLALFFILFAFRDLL